MNIEKQHMAFFDHKYPSKLGTKAAVLWLAMTSLTLDFPEQHEYVFPMQKLKVLGGESEKKVVQGFLKLRDACLITGTCNHEGCRVSFTRLY